MIDINPTTPDSGVLCHRFCTFFCTLFLGIVCVDKIAGQNLGVMGFGNLLRVSDPTVYQILWGCLTEFRIPA